MTTGTSQTITSATGPEPGWADLYRSGRFGITVLIAFGVWLHAADELMVSTITPAMLADIGGEIYVAWLIALYEVGSIVAGALSALSVIRFGLRVALGSAAFIYMAGCVLSAIAPDMGVMLSGRLVQGLGGGAMVAITFVAVHQLFPARMTARAYALLSLVWGASAFSGPFIGASFADYAHWRGGFVFFAVQALVYGAVVLALLERKAEALEAGPETGSSGRRVLSLLVRISLLAGGVVAIASAGTQQNWQTGVVPGIAGAFMIGAFLMLDGRSGNARMLPFGAWKFNKPEGMTAIMVLFVSAASAPLITYGPVLMNRLHDMSAFATGAVLLLESFGWSITAVAIAGLPERYHGKAIAGGFVWFASGAVLLTWAVPNGPVWLIAVGSLMVGSGFGASWSFLVRRAIELAGSEEKERMASAIPNVQRLGYALGAAYTGIIANASGFVSADSAADLLPISYLIFGLALVPAVIGLAATFRFVSLKRPETAG